MHVLSLQNSQFEYLSIDNSDSINREAFDLAEANCQPNYFNSYGCFKNDSYLSTFYKRFWTGDLKSEYNKIQAITDKQDFSNALLAWGHNYETRFVSKNAFVNPEEDMAESFSVWVLGLDLSSLSDEQKQKV